MQTLEDDYIRMMSGMTADAVAPAAAEGTTGSGNAIIESDGAGAAGAAGAAGGGGTMMFRHEDGTNVPARTKTVTRQANKGFGVIVHSAKHSTWIKIQKVTEGGPFGLAGVEAGDIFVAVNGVSVIGQTHKFLKKCLVSAPDTFDVLVTTERELPKTRELRSGVIKRSEVGKGIGIVLYADPYSISNGCVHRVEAGGPCDKAGIAEGDVFVEVDGANVEDVAHKDLVAIFNGAGASIPYVVEVGGATNELPGEVATLPVGVVPRTVRIKRKVETESLGIVLYSDKERRGVQLQLVSKTGPFGRAGVTAGEIVVEVDLYNVLDVTHGEVNDALKHAGTSFDIAVVPADAFDAPPAGASVEAAQHASPPGLPAKPNGLEQMRTHNVIRIPGKGLGIELKSSKNLVGTRAHNVDIAGPMAFAGVNEGDVFVHVNGMPVLNASHKDVIKAFHAAGPEFTVVVIPSATLDVQLSPVVKTKPLSRPKKVAAKVPDDPYDMGKSVEVSKKQKKRLMGQISTSGDMRTEIKSWDSTLERERDLLFSGTSDSMELSQGFLALKKAQKEAQSLQEATKHYEHLFEQQLGGSKAFAKKPRSPAARGRSSPPASPSLPEASASQEDAREPAATSSPLAPPSGGSPGPSPQAAAEGGGGGVNGDGVSWTAYDGEQNAFGPGSFNAAQRRMSQVESKINSGQTATTPPRRRFLNL